MPFNPGNKRAQRARNVPTVGGPMKFGLYPTVGVTLPFLLKLTRCCGPKNAACSGKREAEVACGASVQVCKACNVPLTCPEEAPKGSCVSQEDIKKQVYPVVEGSCEPSGFSSRYCRDCCNGLGLVGGKCYTNDQLAAKHSEEDDQMRDKKLKQLIAAGEQSTLVIDGFVDKAAKLELYCEADINGKMSKYANARSDVVKYINSIYNFYVTTWKCEIKFEKLSTEQNLRTAQNDLCKIAEEFNESKQPILVELRGLESQDPHKVTPEKWVEINAEITKLKEKLLAMEQDTAAQMSEKRKEIEGHKQTIMSLDASLLGGFQNSFKTDNKKWSDLSVCSILMETQQDVFSADKWDSWAMAIAELFDWLQEAGGDDFKDTFEEFVVSFGDAKDIFDAFVSDGRTHTTC